MNGHVALIKNTNDNYLYMCNDLAGEIARHVLILQKDIKCFYKFIRLF
jgi:hypothetical protein